MATTTCRLSTASTPATARRCSTSPDSSSSPRPALSTRCWTRWEVLLANQHRKGQWLTIDAGLDLGFASEQWQRTLVVRAGEPGGALVVDRRHFEVCVFTHLAQELRSGDVAIQGADSYADYREQLLSWQECEPEVVAYCRQLGLPETAEGLVEHLRGWLGGIAADVDAGYPANAHITITEQGEPALKRPARAEPSPSAQALEAALGERLPERNLLDILCDTAHWTGWPRHFGPLSGSEPKLARPTERYLLTTFAYGTNLGRSRPPGTCAAWPARTRWASPTAGM
jgi:hypothetical protein